MAETRAQQLADALRAIARVNHYMVGLVETVTDEELAEAEQLLIAQQNALPEGKRHRDLGLALDITEDMQRARLQAASRGPDSAYIVAVGNPVDGFGFTGPFAGRDAAERWREVNQRLLDGDAWIVPLALPDDYEVDPPAPDVIAALREAADVLEDIIPMHIYDDDEPPDAPERKLVAEWRALVAKAESVR